MRTTNRTKTAVVLTLALLTSGAWAQDLRLPNADDSVKLAVIGDSGTGGSGQRQVAQQMTRMYQQFPFDTVLMLGDNMYGAESAPRHFAAKFERPYQALLEGGVKFYASLGNHDEPNQRFYEGFNMGGERYYTFTRGPVRFFALDSTYMDRNQLAWLERELAGAREPWKIAFFHHPLYSSGRRHGSELDLRALLEPLFVKHGVRVVFAGHEHFYERLRPQNGIQHFTSGAAGKLRRGNIRRGPLTAAGFDRDLSFMLIEIDDDTLHYQVISRSGQTVDGGSLPRAAAAGDRDLTQR